jgi:hypothetical protein
LDIHLNPSLDMDIHHNLSLDTVILLSQAMAILIRMDMEILPINKLV